MENKYKIFDKGFDKILDFIDDVDVEISDRYKKIVSILPDFIKDKTMDCEDYETDNNKFYFGLLRTENSLNLEFTIKGEKYLKTDIYVRRLFEEDLQDENAKIEFFSISQRNTKSKKPSILFREIGGKLVANYTEENNKDKEIEWLYFLEKHDENYLIYKSTYIRGIQVCECIASMEEVELFEYLETDDEYEEELEAYIDLDQDFDDRLNGLK